MGPLGGIGGIIPGGMRGGIPPAIGGRGGPGIIPGGMPTMPGGGLGMPRGKLCAATCTGGCIMPIPGPPMPRTGPARPMGAPPIGSGAPRAGIAFITPGPPGASFSSTSGGGGPSIVIDTTESPRRMIKPNARFSSRSSDSPLVFFARTFRNSCVSPKTMFMCLSNAKKTPTRTRLSTSNVTTIRACNAIRSKQRDLRILQSNPHLVVHIAEHARAPCH